MKASLDHHRGRLCRGRSGDGHDPCGEDGDPARRVSRACFREEMLLLRKKTDHIYTWRSSLLLSRLLFLGENEIGLREQDGQEHDGAARVLTAAHHFAGDQRAENDTEHGFHGKQDGNGSRV